MNTKSNTILLVYIFLLLSSVNLFSQNFQIKTNETCIEFIERIKPKNKLICHKIIEANKLITGYKNSIISFYRQNTSDKTINKYTLMYIYTSKNGTDYVENFVDSLSWDLDVPTEILSVFYVNADGKKGKELAVLISCSGTTKEYSGTFYDVIFYTFSQINNQLEIIRYEKFEDYFPTCDCSWSDGTIHKSRLKTAQTIKDEIRLLTKK
jgi:hypothetical protein